MVMFNCTYSLTFVKSISSALCTFKKLVVTTRVFLVSRWSLNNSSAYNLMAGVAGKTELHSRSPSRVSLLTSCTYRPRYLCGFEGATCTYSAGGAGKRTLPAWGNSGYSRCQLPFSWTELIKVLSCIRYYRVVSALFCISCMLFRF